MIGAIILAAGESKRMGKPKAMLEFADGTTLLTKQVNLLATVSPPSLCKGGVGRVDQVSTPPNLPPPLRLRRAGLQRGGIGNISIVVVLGHEAEKIKKAHPHLEVSWCINKEWRKGQFSSIQEGIKIILNPPIPPLLKGGERGFVLTAIVVLPIDVVGVNAKTISAIINAASQNPEAAAIVPGYNGHKGHPVILSRSFAEHLLTIDSTTPAARLDKQVENAENVISLAVSDPGILRNINTPEEWEEWLRTKTPPL